MNGNGIQLFWTQAIYSLKAKEARVQVLFQGQVIAQLLPQEAADFAAALVQASSNAVSDSFSVNFWIEHEKVSDEEIRQRLIGLGKWRSQHEPMMGADRGRVSRAKGVK